MTTSHTINAAAARRPERGGLWRYLPFLSWMARYRRADLPSDVVAGIVTAIMLIPQSMAYAQLAGLPPQSGLYASVVPLIIYALLGTSGQLSVGPVAITSLLVFSGVGALADPGSARYIALVLLLAIIVGAIKLSLGLLRMGAILNFISHPVLAAFTTASALIIAAGQLKYVLGYKVSGDHLYDILASAVSSLSKTNPVTLGIGLGTIAMLLFFRKGLRPLLKKAGLKPLTVTLIVSGAPLVAVILGILAAWLGQLDTRAGLAVVGSIPSGLSPLSIPEI
ncbi:MAG: sodium-independent anion transporter, partial [Oscillochloris sp.]|nr:sodium-independent anion transporter [Oscillochloris sp.]